MGRARPRLTVDYAEGDLGLDKCWEIKTRFVILSFFTLHCHNILSFVINYTAPAHQLLSCWENSDNIEENLCLSEGGRQGLLCVDRAGVVRGRGLGTVTYHLVGSVCHYLVFTSY